MAHEWCSRWGAVHEKSSRSVPCESGARWALRASFAEASRALPCERGARPGKFTGPGALPCESGARWAVHGRFRVGVVHSGEFTGAPVRAWCASWKVIGGLREFVLVTRPFFRSLRNPSADLICSKCWFFICIAHLEAGGAGFLLCFGALVWEGVQSLSTKKLAERPMREWCKF